MVQVKLKPQNLTKNEFDSITECDCGKPVFRYHNTSKNVFIIKCPNTRYEYDLKSRKWVISKRQPCDLYAVYNGSRPQLAEIKNKIITPYIEKCDIEKRLRLMFDFLLVSKWSSTIQEIDLIVKNKLHREPRKVFYYPSIGHLRVSHRESYTDYRDRIFSEKIVDRSEPVVKQIKNVKIKQRQEYDFVVDTLENTESDRESDSEKSREYSDSDSDSERGDSDYSCNESEISETLSEVVVEEEFDDCENYDYDYDDD